MVPVLQLLADLLDEGDGVSQRLLDTILDAATVTDSDSQAAQRSGDFIASNPCSPVHLTHAMNSFALPRPVHSRQLAERAFGLVSTGWHRR